MVKAAETPLWNPAHDPVGYSRCFYRRRRAWRRNRRWYCGGRTPVYFPSPRLLLLTQSVGSLPLFQLKLTASSSTMQRNQNNHNNYHNHHHPHSNSYFTPRPHLGSDPNRLSVRPKFHPNQPRHQRRLHPKLHHQRLHHPLSIGPFGPQRQQRLA
jgi:hypothetical protein